AGVRVAGGEGGPRLRRHGRDRLARGAGGAGGLPCRRVVPQRGRPAARRRVGRVECNEPYSGELFRDAMKPNVVVARWPGWCAAVLLAGCAGGAARAGMPFAPAPASPADTTPLSHVDSLGHAVAQADQEAAADSAALDSLHGRGRDTTRATLADSASAPAVRGEDVTREAERLFGPEGRAAVGAAPTPGEPLFDIDVTTFAANRRVLEYLEFFQVDSRDRFEIWLSRLGRYEGMIRERLRARGLPEDLVYLT